MVPVWPLGAPGQTSGLSVQGSCPRAAAHQRCPTGQGALVPWVFGHSDNQLTRSLPMLPHKARTLMAVEKESQLSG